jgi:hypothetical protein
MPYIRRDAAGAIASLHREASFEASEFLPEGDPAVLAFVGAGPRDDDGFARLDADFVRVLEDVIDTLIGKNLINITDLPAEAQAKLFSRKSFRERRVSHSLHLYGDADISVPLLPDVPPL